MTLMQWQPEQYDSFSNERSAPISELLHAIPQHNYKKIYDLGCGTGAAISQLQERWPEAEIIGIDSDAEMLTTAKLNHPEITFKQCDILTWVESTSVTEDTLIFSNAALHWLDNHQTLFPKLLALVENNGCLAVQMPNNWQEPSHVEMIKLAKSEPYKSQLLSLIRENPVHSEAEYIQLLLPITNYLRVWEVTYVHKLSGTDPVLNWLKGSSLKYYLDGLSSELHHDFLKQLAETLAKSYEKDADTNTNFPFRRIFIVAQC